MEEVIGNPDSNLHLTAKHSDTSDAEVVVSRISPIPPACPVDHSVGKQMLDIVLPCDVEELFTKLFTNESDFYKDFQSSRKTYNMNLGDWELKHGDAQKTRQLSFTSLTGQTVGPKTCQVSETQTLLPFTQPGKLYVIQSEVSNADIPFADAFTVNSHYCLTRVSSNESRFIAVAKVVFKKTIWLKAIVEKSTMGALGEFFNHLETALKEDCAKAMSLIPASHSPTRVHFDLPPPRRCRKKSRAPSVPDLLSTIKTTATVERKIVRNDFASSMDLIKKSLALQIILAALLLLILLNIVICYKIYQLEMNPHFQETYLSMGNPPQTHQEWIKLLQKKEALLRTKVQDWEKMVALAMIVKTLNQAEMDMEMLKSHMALHQSK